MDQLALGKLLMRIGDLPSLPHIASNVLKLTDDPNSTPGEICGVICQDQVLASKVLKVVNSAYYGLPRRIATISEAITILGLQTLRTLVIGTSVYKTLTSLRVNNAARPEQVWQHALACAVSSKIIALELGISQKEHAFMAGLLHDIGKIILNSFNGPDYIKALELQSVRGCPLVDAEQEVLNVTHAEVGKMVAEKWSLPAVLVDPIGYHHTPLDKVRNPELVMVVHLADIMSMMAGYSTAGNSDFGVNPEVLRSAGISFDQLINISGEIRGTISLELI